jgi:hypothetical protein
LACEILEEQELQLEVEELAKQGSGEDWENLDGLENDAEADSDEEPTEYAEEGGRTSPILTWAVPPVCATASSLRIVSLRSPMTQAPMNVDVSFLAELRLVPDAADKSHIRRSIVIWYADKRRRVDFDPSCLHRLACTQERLDDVCINSCSAMLHHGLSDSSSGHSHFAQSCALFSSFDLVRSRSNASSADIWRQTKHLEYWVKNLWIFPIHRVAPVEHWAVGAAYPDHRLILIFDSIADRGSCEDDVRVS